MVILVNVVNSQCELCVGYKEQGTGLAMLTPISHNEVLESMDWDRFGYHFPCVQDDALLQERLQDFLALRQGMILF